VRGNGRHPEAAVVFLRDVRQPIDVTRELRPAIEGLVGRPRAVRPGAVIKPPDRLRRQFRRKLTGGELLLRELVKGGGNHWESGGIDGRRLERSGTHFACGRVRVLRRSWGQRRNRVGEWYDRQRQHKLRELRTCRLVAGHAVLIRSKAGVGS